MSVNTHNSNLPAKLLGLFGAQAWSCLNQSALSSVNVLLNIFQQDEQIAELKLEALFHFFAKELTKKTITEAQLIILLKALHKQKEQSNALEELSTQLNTATKNCPLTSPHSLEAALETYFKSDSYVQQRQEAENITLALTGNTDKPGLIQRVENELASLKTQPKPDSIKTTMLEDLRDSMLTLRDNNTKEAFDYRSKVLITIAHNNKTALIPQLMLNRSIANQAALAAQARTLDPKKTM